jgi:hypothetical protein
MPSPDDTLPVVQMRNWYSLLMNRMAIPYWDSRKVTPDQDE